MPSVEDQLHHFIVNNFLFGKADEPVTATESLLERGIIDSTGVLELVGFIEQTYNITVEDDELVPENLDSIERLVAFVGRKRQSAMVPEA